MGVAVEGRGKARVDFEVVGVGGVSSSSLWVSNVVLSVSVMRFRKLEINLSICRVPPMMESIRDLRSSRALTVVSTGN